MAKVVFPGRGANRSDPARLSVKKPHPVTPENGRGDDYPGTGAFSVFDVFIEAGHRHFWAGRDYQPFVWPV
jgi:hypothetical protein